MQSNFLILNYKLASFANYLTSILPDESSGADDIISCLRVGSMSFAKVSIKYFISSTVILPSWSWSRVDNDLSKDDSSTYDRIPIISDYRCANGTFSPTSAYILVVKTSISLADNLIPVLSTTFGT